MQMTGRLASLTLALVAGLAACSSSSEENQSAPVNAGNDLAAPEKDAAAEAELPNLATEPTPEPRACPQEPGSMCAGPLVVRADGFNLIGNASGLQLQGSLVFANRASGPVRVAILNEPIVARLDRGGVLKVINATGLVGVTACRRDGAPCLQETPDQFRTLVPGDSPLRVNINLVASNDPALRASLPAVETAEITLQVYAVEASGAGNTLSISLPNVPVRNQIAP